MEYSKLKLLSLFDGSGGFPLAGILCGIEPVFASEVEPYPIAVTRSRLPIMKHLGNICNINGAEIEPVDIVSFGSPCQGLSVAGLQKGLADERSELFLEAVRIIKEMREATNGRYPTFAVWENVPGAFSSNKCEDFRIVLEELIKIAEPSAVMPTVPKGGWAYADYYCGDGWSLAYRVFDAQYIRTAQRRRRIYLVLDLGGERAGEILFKRESLRGYPPKSGTPWQTVATDAQGSIGADDRARECVGFHLLQDPIPNRLVSPCLGQGNSNRGQASIGVCVGFDVYNQSVTGDKSKTLTSVRSDADHAPVVVYDARGNGDGKIVNTITGDHENRVTDYTSVVCESATEQVPFQPVAIGINGDKAGTLDASYYKGCGMREGKERDVIAIDRAFYNQGQNAQYDPQTYEDGTCPTLVAKGPGAVCTREKVRYIVRRLTPTECARLQGFPDRWGHPDRKDDFTDDEYRFWLDVRNTHAEINGKAVKEYTKQQMLTWYNKLHTDSSEYKMWGNGIALPCALYVMEGIVDAMKGGAEE